MSNSILQGKQAVVFGAGGSIGAAIGRQFAAEGADVFLSGRTMSNVEAVARQISTDGGHAYAAVLDAADDAAVNQYLDSIVTETGKLDIVLNATGSRARDYGNGKLAVDLGIEEFLVPMTAIVKSHFITARAAARRMVKQHSGVIIFVTGSPARGHVPGATAIGAAFGAIENLTENLAVEVSPFGVRVVLPASGRFLEVDAPRKIVQRRRYDWESPRGLGRRETTVTYRLVPVAMGTRVTVRHDGFAGTEAADEHAVGWERFLGWLAAYLSSDTR